MPGPLATWPQRVVAYLITFGILLAGYVVVWVVSGILGAVSDVLGLLVSLAGNVVLFVAGLYFWYLDGETGGHPGKRLTGLKTVKIADGQVLGGGMGIVRYLAHMIDSFICCIGWFFPLWDDKRQTIADKVMSTVVIAEQPKASFGPDLFKP